MYLGIDIQKRDSQVAVGFDDGNLQDEIRLPNDRLDELAEQYAGSEVAIEVSGNYRPIFETLDEHCDVMLVDPSKNLIIADATVKTDRVDAKRLALMLRADMLAESYVPPDEFPRFAELVRWNVTRCKRVNPQKDCKPFCVESIAFDFLIANEPCFVRIGDRDGEFWFETVIDEPVVACGFDCCLCANVVARELFEFGALGTYPTLLGIGRVIVQNRYLAVAIVNIYADVLHEWLVV